jgi:hypothetical protein
MLHHFPIYLPSSNSHFSWLFHTGFSHVHLHRKYEICKFCQVIFIIHPISHEIHGKNGKTLHEFHRQFCQVTLQPLFEPFDGPRGSGAGFGAVCGQEFFTMPGDEVTSGNG